MDNSEKVEKPKKERVQFYFEPEAVEMVDKIRDATGLSSRTEVVRYGLGFFRWLLEELSEGSEILVRKKNGELKGILIPLLKKIDSTKKS